MFLHAITRRVDGWLHRSRWWLLVVLTVSFLGLTLPRANTKPLWHDEIYTVLLARLPSWSSTWRAAVDGADLSPPLNLWATRLVYSTGRSGRIATRTPPMIGFWGSMVLIFLILERRAGTTAAICGAMLPIWTAGYRYSYEARGYGLMMGLFAVALFAWSEAAAGRRRRVCIPMLGASLAASLWNHYYGLLAFAPIMAGEFVRAIQRRRIDWGIAAAIGAGMIALVPLHPLIAAAESQRQWFWGTSHGFGDVVDAYRFVVQPLLSRRFLVTGAVVAAALLAALFLVPPIEGERRPPLPAYEVAAGIAALTIPALAVLLGVTITGVFVPRYVMSFAVAFALVVPMVVRAANVRRIPVELLLFAVLVFSFGESAAQTYLNPIAFPNPLDNRPLLLGTLRNGGPTIISGSLQFVQLWYYTPAELQPRVRYVADPERARRFGESYTVDRNYLALARWTSLPVEPYESIGGVRELRVYAFDSGWFMAALRKGGAEITNKGRELGATLYVIRIPQQFSLSNSEIK